MNLDECVSTRKSIREFTDKKVDDSLILEIIKAGVRSPSGGNFQPWYFIVVQNEETIENMRQIVLQKSFEYYGKNPTDPNAFYRIKNYGLLFNAKTIISVCINLSTSCYLNERPNINEIDKLLDSVEVISVGACIQNMLLKINDLGLGACWCRVHYWYRKTLEKLLNIEPPLFLIANISIGYPSDKEKNRKITPRKDIGLTYKIIH